MANHFLLLRIGGTFVTRYSITRNIIIYYLLPITFRLADSDKLEATLRRQEEEDEEEVLKTRQNKKFPSPNHLSILP